MLAFAFNVSYLSYLTPTIGDAGWRPTVISKFAALPKIEAATWPTSVGVVESVDVVRWTNSHGHRILGSRRHSKAGCVHVRAGTVWRAANSVTA